MSSTIVIGLAHGGTAVVLYGLNFTSAINVCLALTLGEMAAAYPAAGGQYVWSSILAGPMVASVVIISAEVIFALVQTYQPSFVIQRRQLFLVYMAVNTASLLCNLFALQRLLRMGTFFLCFSTIIFLAILITCVAAAPSHQSNERMGLSLALSWFWKAPI
ncbi:hypothetical protein JCM24511_02673 [Saitozyma sp. JCM 24511]|nr:hypothetical protein JCM24511_02673 [Saitozyma sp. JCM 24511]